MNPDYQGPERRIQCEAHQAMSDAIVSITTTMAGVAKSSNRVFAVGMALLGVAIGAIFYAGQLHQKVNTLERDIVRIEKKLEHYYYPWKGDK